MNLKSNWQKIIKHQLIAGSAIMFIGNMLFSFGNYLYHLLMGRMLGPIDYGALASLIALSYLANIPITTLTLTVAKYTSALRGQKKFTVINFFYRWITKLSLIFGLIGLFLFVLFSPWLANFLHLDSVFLLLVVGVTSFLGIFMATNLATLQGFLQFNRHVLSNIATVAVKLFLGVALVWWGFSVHGAIFAILVSFLVGFLLSFSFAKKLIGEKQKQEFKGKEIVAYALPVLFSILAFVSLYTTDIVLVRHFLSPQEAGFYAALATLGKIIFFAANPIIMVMFPMVSERHANGKEFFSLFYLSLGMVILICLGISGIYFLFPELMIQILYGSQYLVASPYLWLFAIFLSLYSLSYLLTNFYLSIKKVKVVVLPMIAAGAQIILISIFHQNLSQIIWVSIGVLCLLLVSLMLNFFITIKKSYA